MSRALHATMNVVAANVRARKTVTAAGTGESHLALDDVAIVGTVWAAQVDAILVPLLESVYNESADLAYTDFLGSLAVPVELRAVLARFAEQRLAEARNRLVGVGDMAWSEIRAQLSEGFQLGESIVKLAARIKDVSNIVEPRATTIARSEIVSVSNAGSLDAMRSLGDAGPPTKTFLATMDARTRPEHADADGQSVPIDEPFIVGGEELDYPGDPSGSPENTVNCRCTLTWSEETVTAEQEAILADEEAMAAAANQDVHDGAMIALVPCAADAQRFAVQGWEPPEQLHTTLAFLGDAVNVTPEAEQVYADICAGLANSPPVTGSVHGYGIFNAAGDNPSTNYLVSDIRPDGQESGDPAAHPLKSMHGQVMADLDDYGLEGIPAQHSPWVSHMAAGYGLDPSALTEMGTNVVYDRLLLSVGDRDTIFPLVQSDQETTMKTVLNFPKADVDAAKVLDVSRYALLASAANLTGHDKNRFVVIAAAFDSFDSTVTGAPEAEGPIAIEGEETGDGREFAPGSLTWDTPPLPLTWQPVSEPEHGGAVLVGLITSIERRGNLIWAQTIFDHGSDAGAEAFRLMGGPDEYGVCGEQFLKGVSVDVDSVKDSDVELIQAADGEPVDLFGPPPELTIFHAGRIRGACLLSMPAFAGAELHLIDTAAIPVSGAPGYESEPGMLVENAAALGDALVAAAYSVSIPDLPPAWWFDEPTDVELDGALTVTDDGRVFGLLAPARTRHISPQFKGRTVPLGVDYSRFHRGSTICEGGERIVTGNLTMECGHDNNLGHNGDQAMTHYDNSCSLAARIRCGESNGKAWVAGALMPGVTPEQLVRMMACQASGDWRPSPKGGIELSAALLVPVPGFPMARRTASVRYKEGVLVASAVPVRFESMHPARPAIHAGREIADRIASSVGRSRRTIAAELAARVRG